MLVIDLCISIYFIAIVVFYFHEDYIINHYNL